MSAELKFLNDIAKPWDELNALLIKRYAFQPDLSAITTQVSSISTAIKHQVDLHAHEQRRPTKNLQKEVDAESDTARLMSDVSDVAKHVVLREPSRQNHVFVAAMFEVNSEGCFRFLRNGVFIEHATLGRQDFMCAALSAIGYWIKIRSLQTTWVGTIREANADFFPTAFLDFNQKYCLSMSSVRIMFFNRDNSGNLQPFDPKEVRLEVR